MNAAVSQADARVEAYGSTAKFEAARLFFLGLGARSPALKWAAMLNDARDYWLSAAPCVLIFEQVNKKRRADAEAKLPPQVRTR